MQKRNMRQILNEIIPKKVGNKNALEKPLEVLIDANNNIDRDFQ